MNPDRFLALVVLLVSTTTFQPARAQEHPGMAEHSGMAEHPGTENSIFAVAANADDFKTFIAVVEAAGLMEQFQGKGPFTVFVPTDAAFAKLPAGTLENLLEPANQAQLAGLLACHVVPGKIMAADVKTMKATNINGQDLDIEVMDGVLTVDGARVIRADMVADNGVIYAIDTVLVPTNSGDGMPTSDKPKDHPAH